MRRNLNGVETPGSELNQLVPEFGKRNDALKIEKKELDIISTRIKDIMSMMVDARYTAGGYQAQYIVKNQSHMDEDALLKVLQKYRDLCDSLGLIKTKEYVDMEALESALYHDKFADEIVDEISSCKVTKEIPSLTVKKVKVAK